MSTFPGSRPRPASPPLPPAPPYREGSASPAAGQERKERRRAERSGSERARQGRRADRAGDGVGGSRRGGGSGGRDGAGRRAARRPARGRRAPDSRRGAPSPRPGSGAGPRSAHRPAPGPRTPRRSSQGPGPPSRGPRARGRARVVRRARIASGPGKPLHSALAGRHDVSTRPATLRNRSSASRPRIPPTSTSSARAWGEPGEPLPWGWGRRTSWIDAEATPHHPVFLRSGRVVVEAPGQLDEHAGLVAHRPGVMPGRQHHDVVRTKLILGPIIHDHMQAA
jgi:hypothetical protein